MTKIRLFYSGAIALILPKFKDITKFVFKLICYIFSLLSNIFFLFVSGCLSVCLCLSVCKSVCYSVSIFVWLDRSQLNWLWKMSFWHLHVMHFVFSSVTETWHKLGWSEYKQGKKVCFFFSKSINYFFIHLSFRLNLINRNGCTKTRD